MISKKMLTEFFSEMTDEYHNNIEPYWCTFGMDEVNGGFIGQVDHNNKLDYSANKSCILNTRILWSFSRAYKEFGTAQSKLLAERAFDYVLEHFVDQKYGGIYWELDAKGEVVDTRKHVYAQAFAIYGLIEYYSAFGDTKALILSESLFQLIEKHCVDNTHGGYFEAFNRKWELNEDVRLSEKDANEPKSNNTHLHVLEAYTSLYQFAPNEQLKERLHELISIFFHHILSSDSKSFECFFSEDWKPRSSLISFGHDIETTWLLTEAIHAIQDENKELLQQIVKSVADHVLTYGVDSDGGLINEAKTDGSLNDYSKDWWPQAEAVVGFLNAYQITGDLKYLESAIKVWRFIQTHIIDHQNGEWFEKVNKKGEPLTKLAKIRAWKAPYHNTRAIFEARKRITSILSPSSAVLSS